MDTAAILADWFKMRIYNRTLINDTSGCLSITDTVFKNQLQGYALQGELRALYRTKVITTTVYPTLKNKLFVGLNLGYSIENSDMSVIPNLNLLTKKEHLYNLGYDPFGKQVYFGIGFKIGKR